MNGWIYAGPKTTPSVVSKPNQVSARIFRAPKFANLTGTYAVPFLRRLCLFKAKRVLKQNKTFLYQISKLIEAPRRTLNIETGNLERAASQRPGIRRRYYTTEEVGFNRRAISMLEGSR